ncbi:MAG: glutathione S-transferase family protein [Holosporales bacterium]|jgi:glutathione S-transferase|nr:glutathione S-transferase family protein [Holosporales bacterium]
MRKLFQYPLCGFSRAVRVTLSEKRLDYEMVYEAPWAPSDALVEYNMLGQVPVLVDIGGTAISGGSAIREYLNEVYPEVELIGSEPVQKAESRQITDWFDHIFYKDVYYPIIKEKILKRFAKNIDRSPDPAYVRIANSKLAEHLDYISWLIDRRNWLAGKNFSIADIHAASFISVLDYLGIIQWNKYEMAKSWYARIKSRPSFRSVLNDNLPQVPPNADYSNLDF